MAGKFNSIFRGAFQSAADGSLGLGKRPVVFDILGPDLETSLLPDNLKLVLHVNPRSMKFSYSKIIERIQTKGGYVEQHFGEGTRSIAFEFATGGFMRLFVGAMATTGGGIDLGGTRRQTLAYDSYLDLLALFENGGHVYDRDNNVVMAGIIKISFDGQEWYGWFDDFNVSEDAEKPYSFSISANFTVSKEYMTIKSTIANPDSLSRGPDQGTLGSQSEGLFDTVVDYGQEDLFPDPDDPGTVRVNITGTGLAGGTEDVEPGFEGFEFDAGGEEGGLGVTAEDGVATEDGGFDFGGG